MLSSLCVGVLLGQKEIMQVIAISIELRKKGVV